MKTGIQEKKLRNVDPHFLTLSFLGLINILIGKDSELNLDKQALAEEIVKQFLTGAQNE